MPLAGESPPYPAPAGAETPRQGWLPWLGMNLWLLACVTYVRDDGPLEGRQAGLVARSRADQRRFAALQLYLAE
jgi:hypothetical protein